MYRGESKGATEQLNLEKMKEAKDKYTPDVI